MQGAPRPEEPPAIPPWQLALRFVLEIGALAGISVWAWHLAGHGVLGWVAAVAAFLGVAAVWGTFAVPGDPSRSGKAPVPVSGWLRMAIELGVFFGGAAAMASLNAWRWFDPFIAGVVVHHVGTRARIQWLLQKA
jgi:hypothetical protein